MYAQINLQSQLSGASPHQLITMLFDGAHNAILRAAIYFETGNIAKRGEMISKAVNIINSGLRSALDHEIGGKITHDLDMLYEYISRVLIESNLHSDPSKLSHADDLLMKIADTWKEIAPNTK
jgi:flagellar protein FliS